jgi:acetyl esterase/lipase
MAASPHLSDLAASGDEENMRRSLTLGVILVALNSFISVGSAGLVYIDPLYGYQKTSDVQFGVGNTNLGGMPLLLDVYQPVDIGNGPVLPNRPAVVIQDGGAWTSGKKTNGRVVTPAIFLAQRGYTVFIADYRQVGDSPSTAGPGRWSNLNPSANGSVLGFLTAIYPGVNTVRAGIEDYAKAITYVRQNAGLFGIDPAYIAGIGGSAGGINLLDLQYNGDTSAELYRTQANISAVGSMMGDWNKVGPNGAPLFLWNNQLDPLIHYYNDIPNLHNKLLQNGIYFEQWFEYPDITDHNVHYDQYPTPDLSVPYMAGFDDSKLILDRMADFLAYHFTPTGPISIPESSSSALVAVAMIGFIALVSLAKVPSGGRLLASDSIAAEQNKMSR